MGLYAYPSRLTFQKRRTIAEMALITLATIVFLALIGFACVQDERDAQALSNTSTVAKR